MHAAEPVNVTGTLLFPADDGLHGSELWKTDGTPAGTVLVKDIFPGADGSMPSYRVVVCPRVVRVGGMLFLAASEGVNGLELWRRDGTEGGTVLVRDLS